MGSAISKWDKFNIFAISVKNIFHNSKCYMGHHPFIALHFFSDSFKAPIPFIRVLLSKILDYQIDFLDEKWFSILLGIFLIPMDGLVSGILIYCIIPYASLKRGIKIAWTRQDYDEHQSIIAGWFEDWITVENLPQLNTFEFLGEALPRLILVIIFTSNNYPFLSETKRFFGINELTISLVSMIFSAGSLFFGIYTGIPPLYKEVTERGEGF